MLWLEYWRLRFKAPRLEDKVPSNSMTFSSAKPQLHVKKLLQRNASYWVWDCYLHELLANLANQTPQAHRTHSHDSRLDVLYQIRARCSSLLMSTIYSVIYIAIPFNSPVDILSFKLAALDYNAIIVISCSIKSKRLRIQSIKLPQITSTGLIFLKW